MQSASDRKPVDSKGEEIVRYTRRARLHRFFFGDDVFISYARQDSDYALALADELTREKVFCFLDQWGTPAGKELPAELVETLKKCSMLVVVGTSWAAASENVMKEVLEFRKTRRPIVPITFVEEKEFIRIRNYDIPKGLKGTLEDADWYDIIAGIALRFESKARLKAPKPDDEVKPSAPVINRIVNAKGFRSRSRRLRQTFWVTCASLLAILITTGIFTSRQISEANAQVRVANGQRAAAEGQTNLAVEKQHAAETARTKAEGDTKKAEKATNKALEDMRRARTLAGEARKQQELAEAHMRQAEKLEQIANQNAAETEREERAARAVILSRMPGREFQAVGEAARAASEQARAKRPLSAQIVGALTAAVVSAEDALPLDGVLGEVKYTQISPDGRLTFVATFDSATDTVRWGLWDTRTGEPLPGGPLLEKTQRSGSWFPVSASFSGDGKRLSIVSPPDYEPSVFDLESRHSDHPVKLRSDRAVLNRAGNHLAFVLRQNRVLDLNLETDKEESVAHPFDLVTALAYAPDGRLLLEGRVQNPGSSLMSSFIFDARTGGRVHPPWEGLAGIAPNGQLIIVKKHANIIGEEQTTDADVVYLCNPSSGEAVETFSGLKGTISSATFDGEQMRALTLSGGQLRVAGVRAYPDFAVLRAHKDHVVTANFSPDGQMSVTTSAHGTVLLWDAHTGKLLRTLKSRADERVRYAAFSADGGRLAVVTESSLIDTWDTRTGDRCPTPRPAVELSSDIGVPKAISFLPGGTKLVTADNAGILIIWDAQTCKPIRSLLLASPGEKPEDEEGYIEVAGFSADGGRAFAVHTMSKTGRLVTLTVPPGQASAGANVEVVKTKESLPRGRIAAVSFSPWGLRALFKLKDNSLELWQQGGPTRKLDNPVGDVFDASFSTDGERLAALGRNGEVAVWDLRGDVKVLHFASGFHKEMINPIALSPDGTRLIIAVDNAARIYPTSPESFVRVALRLLGGAVSGP